MKHLISFLFILIFFSFHGFGQTGLPKDEIIIEAVYEPSSPYDYIIVKSKVDRKKKLKVKLPSYYCVSGTPKFITDYVVAIPVIDCTELVMGKYHVNGNPVVLYAPYANGGAGAFIQNAYYKDYSNPAYFFTYLQTLPCAFYCDGFIYDAQGNLVDENYTDVKCYTDAFVARRRIYNQYDSKVDVYTSYDCKVLPYAFDKNSIFYSNQKMLVMMYQDSVYFYDIQTQKIEKKYRGLTSQNIERLRKIMDEKKNFGNNEYFPVMTQNGWGYADIKGNLLLNNLSYDIVYPYMNYRLAPVKKNGKWGFINKEGVEIFSCRFDSLFYDFDFGKVIYHIKSNDSTFYINSDNKLVYKDFDKERKKELESASEPKYGNTCLVYTFKNPDTEEYAYILYNVSYYLDKIDHNKMSAYVLNNIASEMSLLWGQGYYRVNEVWNNPYKADYLHLDVGCYHVKSEYEQKTKQVISYEKFFD